MLVHTAYSLQSRMSVGSVGWSLLVVLCLNHHILRIWSITGVQGYRRRV